MRQKILLSIATLQDQLADPEVSSKFKALVVYPQLKDLQEMLKEFPSDESTHF